MRKIVLYIITILTFPLIIFNILATIFIPFLGFFSYSNILYLVYIELFIWGMVFLASLFFKRAHCSHSCAISGIFEIISNITKSKDIMTMKQPKVIKYIVLFLWFAGFGFVCICMLADRFQWFYVAPIYLNPFIVLYYLLFAVSGILSLTIGKSTTQHYICPFSPWTNTGINISLVFRIPSLTIMTDKEKCVQCKQCNRNCPLNENVCEKVNTNHFDQRQCINCFECVATCITGAISKKWKM